MALDGWKKIETQKSGSAVERVRQRGEAARTEVRTDQGKISPKLTDALRELQKGEVKKEGPKVGGEGRENFGAREVVKGETRKGNAGETRELPNSLTSIQAAVAVNGEGAKTGKAVAHEIQKGGIRPSDISSSRSSAETSNVASRSQTLAASTFTVVEPKPQLADVLIRRSVPPTPPKTTDAPEKNRPATAQTQEPLPTTQDAKGIAALPQTAQGTQTADPKFKDKDSGAEKRSEEKRTARNEKNSGKAGKGGAAHRKESGDSGEGQALQAASSGIASDGGEPAWIADIPPTLQIYNETSDALPYVLVRYRWYKQYVEKNPDKSGEVVRIFERAVQLDGELEKILKEGLAARANVYGGTSA